MINLKKQKIILIIAAVILSLFPFFVSAHGLVPCGGINENPCTVQDFFSLIARVTNWLISVAGIYAVFRMVYAGFWLTISMGNQESIAKWQGALTNAVIGLVLVMTSFLIINSAINFIILSDAPTCQKVDLANPSSYFTTNCPTTSK